MKIRLFILMAFGLFIACQNEPKTAPDKIVLPNTPVEVAQQWVEAFYNDDYPKAVQLGTDFTRMMIDSVRKEMVPNAPEIAFKISGMSCETVKDSAFCTYIYQEEGEDYEEFVNLLKVNDQWLVDATWEPSDGSESELEELLREEFDKIMEEEGKE